MEVIDAADSQRSRAGAGVLFLIIVHLSTTLAAYIIHTLSYPLHTFLAHRTMRQIDIHFLLVVLFLSRSSMAFLSHQWRAAQTANAIAIQATQSVYHSADPSKLLRQTDYLRGKHLPRPPPAKKESTVSIADYYGGLLERATVSFDSAAAKEILDKISSMRQTNNNPEKIALFLDSLLEKGPDRKLPLWSRLRFLSRFSNRARMATLRRTLDLTTPPPNVEDEANDTAEDQQRRRRRALLSLLRTLSSTDEASSTIRPAIVAIEKRAQREKKAKSLGDMRSRLPQDLETPKYDVIAEKNGCEIRRYQPFSVCSVEMNKPRPVDAYNTDATVSDPKVGGAQAFGALAGYLFGKNQQKTSMKMTTPVINRGEADSKTMSFVLPSKFWNPDGVTNAPQPLEGSGVILERLEAEERAVIMFGGYASKKDVDAKKKKLLETLESDKDWMAVNQSATLAQYNDPFTPPWKRLNEVSVAVKPRR